MECGTWEMIRFIEKKFGKSVFKREFTSAGPGDFSPGSWKYWSLVTGIKRKYPERKII